MLIWWLHCRSDMHWWRWHFRWKLWCEWEYWFEFSFCWALLSHAHFIAASDSVRSSAHELMWWKLWLDFSAAAESACWTSWIFWTDELNCTFLMQRMSCSDKFSSCNIIIFIMQINDQIIHIHNVYFKFFSSYIYIDQNLLIFRLLKLFRKSNKHILLKIFNFYHLIWNDLQCFIRYNMINELFCIVNKIDL